MTDRDSLERLAQRGTPVGAERLADRIEARLTGRPSLAGPSDERRSPLVMRALAAAGVAASLIAVAVVWRVIAADEPVALGPGGPAGLPVTVTYERSEYTQFMDFIACPDGEPEVSGTFDAMIIEAWFDPVGDRFRQVTTYPDGSTREVITLGTYEGSFETFESLEPATRRAQCLVGRAGSWTMFRDPTISNFPDMTNARAGRVWSSSPDEGVLRAGIHADSVGRAATLRVLERPIHPGGGLTVSWFFDPETDEALEIVFRDTWPEHYDAGWTRTVTVYEEIVVNDGVFSVDDMTLVYSTETSLETLLAEPFSDGPALGSEGVVWPPDTGDYPNGQEAATGFAVEILGWEVDEAERVDLGTYAIQAGEHELTVFTDRWSNGYGVLSAGDALSIAGAEQGQPHRQVVVSPIGASGEIGVSTSDGATRWWRVPLGAEPPVSVFVDLPGLGDARVRAILVLWRDAEGQVITADAGWFGD